MNSEILSLYRLSRKLLYLGTDGAPVYSDELARLNREVWSQACRLSGLHGSTPDEEAFLCLTLLLAYDATLYDNGDKWERVQRLLERSLPVLEILSPSPLKAHLLVRCYGVVFDDDLARQAHSIIDSWNLAQLTPDQQAVVSELEMFESCPRGWEDCMES